MWMQSGESPLFPTLERAQARVIDSAKATAEVKVRSAMEVS